MNFTDEIRISMCAAIEKGIQVSWIKKERFYNCEPEDIYLINAYARNFSAVIGHDCPMLPRSNIWIEYAFKTMLVKNCPESKMLMTFWICIINQNFQECARRIPLTTKLLMMYESMFLKFYNPNLCEEAFREHKDFINFSGRWRDMSAPAKSRFQRFHLK